LWRVVYEGRNLRLKVYPNGRTEEFNGKGNSPVWQEVTEVLRVAPSKEKGKIDAAVSVFKRYASESISFTALAHHLNGLGWRTSYGGLFQGHHIESMLGDPTYLGYYTWNKLHAGKFHRYKDGQTVPELNYEEKVSKNDKADWVQSHRLFDPLVGQKTWDAVQKKLGQRSPAARSPRSAAQYLAGLVYCGNCGCRMVTGSLRKTTKNPRKDGHTGPRYEYFCGTYFKAAREGWPREGAVRREPCKCKCKPCKCTRAECSCLRNGVFQDVLGWYVTRYLEETGKRLELLTEGLDAGHLTDRMEGQEETAWRGFIDGIHRLTGYLAEHHPAEYDAILREQQQRAAEEEEMIRAARNSPPSPEPTTEQLAEALGEEGLAAMREFGKEKYDGWKSVDDFTYACVQCYRANFDPAAVEAEIERLDAQHTALMDKWAGLTLPLAREKVNRQIATLEIRIEELKQQRRDVAGLVEQHYREMCDLKLAIADAKLAMRAEAGERALRQRAEALRAVVQRIECTFTATGATGGGWGKKNSQLVKVTIYPVVGESVEFSADSKGTLLYSNAHSFIYRTRLGRMR
jgi:hypothetical protein